MAKTQVLLAEDDFGSILKQYLELHDFEVDWCVDGEAALKTIKEKRGNCDTMPDICVFDVMMPKMDGFQLAEQVSILEPEIPFVFLTAKKMKEDRIRGLKLGADDYILKPFEADILVLRLKNILKRTAKSLEPLAREDTSEVGAYIFSASKRRLSIGDEHQNLTDKEAQLIHFFLLNKNKLVKREDLLSAVWGNDDFFSGRSMDVFISRLRKYFKKDDAISIESTRGLGLTFKVKTN